MSSDTPLGHQTDTYVNPFEIGAELDGDSGGTSTGFNDPLTSSSGGILEPEFVDLSSPRAASHQNNNTTGSIGGSISKGTATTAINIDSSTVSGNIGGSGGTPDRFFDGNTLDEPVSETILRDMRNVAMKLQQVLHPKARRDVLKDWDLWGPLILCLSLAIMLSMAAEGDQEVLVFTMVFVIVWCGGAIVTVNAKLLGGNVSFFQSVCVLGYCIFPLDIVALISLFVKQIIIRFPLVILAFAWCSYASVNFLSSSHLANRRALAVYPLFLFYFVIAWMVLITN